MIFAKFGDTALSKDEAIDLRGAYLAAFIRLKHSFHDTLALNFPLDARFVLVSLLCKYLGVELQLETEKTLRSMPEVWDLFKPFDEMDIKSVSPVVQGMNIAHHSQGMAFKLKSANYSGEVKERLLWQAIGHFQKALDISPNNKNSIRNIAECYEEVGNMDLARYYFEMLFRVEKSPDVTSRFKYAGFLEKCGEFDAGKIQV